MIMQQSLFNWVSCTFWHVCHPIYSTYSRKLPLLEESPNSTPKTRDDYGDRNDEDKEVDTVVQIIRRYFLQLSTS